ncbi:MAG: ferritin-like domain-containing protein, partial [Deltaproteobacteria bacterium]|nr:ferritin-like domain-containing protein [Deltaproteobacteria bacterium]
AGVVPATVEVTPTRLRDVFALALDNAVEGCVHEAFAAVLCRFQAVTCRDLALAADLDVIAEDEARHGELAWAIARWLEPQLTAAQRAVVERARAVALAALAERTARQLAPFAMAAAPLGMPSGAQARVLAHGFAAALAAA